MEVLQWRKIYKLGDDELHTLPVVDSSKVTFLWFLNKDEILIPFMYCLEPFSYRKSMYVLLEDKITHLHGFVTWLMYIRDSALPDNFLDNLTAILYYVWNDFEMRRIWMFYGEHKSWNLLLSGSVCYRLYSWPNMSSFTVKLYLVRGRHLKFSDHFGSLYLTYLVRSFNVKYFRVNLIEPSLGSEIKLPSWVGQIKTDEILNLPLKILNAGLFYSGNMLMELKLFSKKNSSIHAT